MLYVKKHYTYQVLKKLLNQYPDICASKEVQKLTDSKSKITSFRKKNLFPFEPNALSINQSNSSVVATTIMRYSSVMRLIAAISKHDLKNEQTKKCKKNHKT